jgi:hypothetical protein
MAKYRSGAALIDAALGRADVQDATDRHPRSEVLGYVNQGRTELYDILVDEYGRSYFRSPDPWVITTAENTTLYTDDFPPTFYRLIGVRVSDCCGHGATPLVPIQPMEEPWFLDPCPSGWPTHYDLRPNGIAVYPEHQANLRVTVEWIPACQDLADDTSTTNADGVNGWDEYVVEYAAMCIGRKDEEDGLIADCLREMERLKQRIKRMAKNRDAFRPRRVQDVRGPRMGYIPGLGRLR